MAATHLMRLRWYLSHRVRRDAKLVRGMLKDNPPMATSIEEITKEVVELLPLRHQRLALIRSPLDLDHPGKTEEIDTAWDEEIRARVAAVDDGRVEGISYDQIKHEMAARFSGR